ncbi:aminopeptidase P family protein [Lacibacterium aquatile]|uniref:Aminopeptidase P family protein n=1 Tax=Lacibacterium aquatile TaxID=1168082 RepID=A0ABW5DT34_9PROT
MSECRAEYQGDEALAGLLAKQGGRSVAEVKTLLAGVNAAALYGDDTDWARLISNDPTPALIAQLSALRAALAPVASTETHGARLALLRAELAKRDLDGFLIPRADEHQGEYVPAQAERLEWLTGFKGSAGMAAVLTDRAAIFVDGRYTLQVRDQVDMTAYEARHLIEQPPAEWLVEVASAGQKIGFDPWLHTLDQAERLQAALGAAGIQLVALSSNPLDAVWADQPPPPLGPVRIQADAQSGRVSAEKRSEIAGQLSNQRVDTAILTTPDSIAWLLNIRGSDVPHTPFALGFALLHSDGTVDLAIDERKILPDTKLHLGNGVRLHAPASFPSLLDALKNKRVLLDPAWAGFAIAHRLNEAGATIIRGADPCLLPKATKNSVELAGTTTAHVRDGAAMVRFLKWLEENSRDGTLKEIEASDKLEEFRKATGLLRDLSFDSISGAGSNGAIVHYRATPETEKTLELGNLYLIDSGAQYVDGTTDITRTLAIGTPTAEMARNFTLVLKGHIAISTAVFPTGTTGSQIDVLARLPLWQHGLDYDHGTGHGVGSYLSVHEGPQRISKAPNTIALKPGMILSNEPGYYKSGGYGIRIENLIYVTPVTIDGAERPMLGFENLTLAPIDRRLIVADLLSPTERTWLNAYHAKVRDTLSPLLDTETALWLAQVTAEV